MSAQSHSEIFRNVLDTAASGVSSCRQIFWMFDFHVSVCLCVSVCVCVCLCVSVCVGVKEGQVVSQDLLQMVETTCAYLG